MTNSLKTFKEES